MNTTLHFSSATDNWETPQYFFDKLNEKYKFTLDVAASKQNAKCPRFFTKEDNGLFKSWQGEVCWMNPPYGRDIIGWLDKAHSEWMLGNSTIICLVPSRTDTAWWHDFAMKENIEFIRGRLKFGGHVNAAPFPSALISFIKP